MSSICTNNGSYTLTVTFQPGTDSDMAQVLVQNRVALALPVVPALVQNEGVTVKKQSPATLMIINLIGDGDKTIRFILVITPRFISRTNWPASRGSPASTISANAATTTA